MVASGTSDCGARCQWGRLASRFCPRDRSQVLNRMRVGPQDGFSALVRLRIDFGPCFGDLIGGGRRRRGRHYSPAFKVSRLLNASLFDFSARHDIECYAWSFFQSRFANLTTGAMYLVLGPSRYHLRILSGLRLTLYRAANLFLQWDHDAFLRCFGHEEYVNSVVTIEVNSAKSRRIVVFFHLFRLFRCCNTRLLRFNVQVSYLFYRNSFGLVVGGRR